LAARSGSGDDLDPSHVYRLEPLNLLLRILEWDGADQVVAPVDDGNDLAWMGRLVWGKGRHIRSVTQWSWQPGPASKGLQRARSALARGLPHHEWRRGGIRQDQESGTCGRAHRAIGAYRTDASRSKSLNGAMRSHNAADQSHLRRPSARCRRQSRGPQRSIPNRPLRR
jgi:hypothetical protein